MLGDPGFDLSCAAVCGAASEHHLTPEELGGLAANAGVNQLVAVHIPFVTKSAEEDAKYVSRISAKFGGSVTISIDQAAY